MATTDDDKLKLRHAMERYSRAAHEVEMAENQMAIAKIRLRDAEKVLKEANDQLGQIALAGGQKYRVLRIGSDALFTISLKADGTGWSVNKVAVEKVD